MPRLGIVVIVGCFVVACGTTTPLPPEDGGADAGHTIDGGVDAGMSSGPSDAGDAGSEDGGDAGLADASTPDAGDAGAGDAGDAGPGDAGDGGSFDAGSDAGSPDAGDCAGGCGLARECCHGECVNLTNNPLNCGACGVECSGSLSFCSGFCQGTPCSIAGCSNGELCCGSSCCGSGQLCCDDQGTVSHTPTCFTPTAASPTCPGG